MSMVVRTNTMAMNANRTLGINNSNVSKSIEKLSSGYRINRAADDASGLAISEKMKAQIVGLEQASTNSQDGISLIQTAEGATTEIHNMLNRMYELAIKSANGTIQNEVDREAITSEVEALKTEIDRICDSTNFNGIDLLNGNLASESATVNTSAEILVEGTAVTGTEVVVNDKATVATNLTADSDVTGTVKYTVTIDGQTFESTGLGGAGQTAAQEFATIDFSGETGLNVSLNSDGTISAWYDDDTTANLDVSTISVSGAVTSSGAATVVAGSTTEQFDVSAALTDGDTVTIDGTDYTYVAAGADTNNGEFGSLADIETLLADTDWTVAGNDLTDISIYKSETATEGGLTLQVGDTNQDFNKVTVGIDDLRCESLGIGAPTGDLTKSQVVDLSTEDTAGESVQLIKDAINMVSTNRANLGALQNRLEYTINNLDTTAENMTAANSRIRDTDMATEMMEYTKNNVLTQAAQSMLAQANQQPQSILQLLG